MTRRNYRLLVIATCIFVVGSSAASGFWWWRRGRPYRPLDAGRAAYARKDWPAAEKAAREHLKNHRSDKEALILLARSLFRQSRDDSASKIYEQLSTETMSSEDFYLRGMAFLRSGQAEFAILAWRRGLGNNPNHVETLVALESIFSRVDLLAEAARAATTLSAQPGWKSRSDLHLGKIRWEQGDIAKAAAAFESALERPGEWQGIDSTDRVRKQLIRLHLQAGRPALARREAAKLAQPDDPETCWLLCRCDVQEGKAPDTAVLARAGLYRKAHPMEPEPSPYAGERACAVCHKTEYGTQHLSRHARTYWRKEQFATLPFPEKPIADSGNPKVTHSFHLRPDALEIQSRAADSVFASIVDYAFGSADRGLTFVGHDENRHFYECRMSYYAEPVGWDVTSGHPIDENLPPELYQGMPLTEDAVRRCFVCHVTNSYAALNQTGPEAADQAIGCERCHGPGTNHIKTIAASPVPLPNHLDLAIARPTQAKASEVVALCAGCHSPRDRDFNLTPGSPDSARFQGTTLTWSRCYTESGDLLSCASCHNPHKNAEKKHEIYERRCLECHGNSSTVLQEKDAKQRRNDKPPANSCPVQPAHNCVECHMPKVKTPVSHALFTDHFIRVHRSDDLADKSTVGKAH
jgi:tetratricopeptide (TPR) repeat protein